MENNVFLSFLDMIAWRMESPQMFGAFHIAASLSVSAAAAAAAVFFARRIRYSADPEKLITGTLSFTGWILVVLEICKQLFLFHIVNGGAYDWWFFPFQLCSVPMYLCILMPLAKGRLRRTFLTFMSGYTFVSAVATLVYPEDILRSFVSLTIHGFVWHGILLFISLLIFFSGACDLSASGILKASGLFAVLCLIAVSINIAVEPVMPAIRTAHPGVAHSWAAMFYMNPFHISPQPVVDSIQKTAGIPAGLVIYALAIMTVSSIVVLCFKGILGTRISDSIKDRS